MKNLILIILTAVVMTATSCNSFNQNNYGLLPCETLPPKAVPIEPKKVERCATIKTKSATVSRDVHPDEKVAAHHSTVSKQKAPAVTTPTSQGRYSRVIKIESGQPKGELRFPEGDVTDEVITNLLTEWISKARADSSILASQGDHQAEGAVKRFCESYEVLMRRGDLRKDQLEMIQESIRRKLESGTDSGKTEARIVSIALRRWCKVE